jgi:hypothetical protein
LVVICLTIMVCAGQVAKFTPWLSTVDDEEEDTKLNQPNREELH